MEIFEQIRKGGGDQSGFSEVVQSLNVMAQGVATEWGLKWLEERR